MEINKKGMRKAMKQQYLWAKNSMLLDFICYYQMKGEEVYSA